MTSTTHTGHQTTNTVTAAEVRRILRRGGARAWFLVAALLGVGSVVAATALSGSGAAQDSVGLNAADVVSVGPFVAGLALALATTVHVPRDIGDGVVMTARFLVPRHRLLFAARLLSWCQLTAIVATAAALVPLPFVLLLGQVVPSSPFRIMVAVAISVVLAVVLVALAHGAATVLQRGSLVVLVGMALLVLVPLAAGVVGALLTGVAATAVGVLDGISLGSLLGGALRAPTAQGQPWGSWAWSVVGLLVWVLLTTALAYRRSSSAGFGDR